MLQIQHILFPTDRTAWSKSVFEHALFYARHHRARLHVLSVTWHAPEPGPQALPDDAFRASLHEAAQAAGVSLAEAQQQALYCDTGILAHAATIDADLIVMATHGQRGLHHAVVGSVAEAVVRHARCPVLTVQPDARYTTPQAQRILVPLDFSVHARRALAHARELQALTGAELHLLHVVQTLPSYGLLETPDDVRPVSSAEWAKAEDALRDVAAEVLGQAHTPKLHITGGLGNPALGVLDTARSLDADLIVLATHGRTGVRRFFMGSVAEKVVQLATCPVFTLKAFGTSLVVPRAGADAEATHAAER